MHEYIGGYFHNDFLLIHTHRTLLPVKVHLYPSRLKGSKHALSWPDTVARRRDAIPPKRNIPRSRLSIVPSNLMGKAERGKSHGRVKIESVVLVRGRVDPSVVDLIN